LSYRKIVRRSKCLVLFLPLVLLFSNCTKKKHPEKYLPRDAAVVTVLDIQNMALKVMDLNLLFDERMFWNITPDETGKNKPDTAGEVPFIESGLDFVSRFYMISSFGEQDNPSYLGLILPLADHSSFRKFAVSRSNQKMTVSPNNVHFTYLKRGGILGWNKEVAVYLVATERRLDNTLEGELFRIFSLNAEHQLVNFYPSFKELQSRTFDVGFWINMKHLKNSPFPVARYLAKGTLDEGIYTGMVNFNDGAIDISTNLTTEETGTDIHILKKDIDSEIWNHVAGEKISGVACLGLNMKTIFDEFESEGIISQSNNYLSFFNITLEELLDHLSGDLSAVILPPGEGDNKERFLIEIGMKNQEVSDKLIESLKDMGFLKPNGENYLLMNKFHLVEKPEKLLLTNDEGLIQTSFDPASQATGFKGKSKQYSMIFYLDFLSIPDYLAAQYGAQLESFSLNVEELESIEFLQGSLINQQAAGSIKILFIDKETNSLRQIVNYVKRMSEEGKVGA
jgi:Domain of unknown function (DUF4836)